MEVTTNHSAVSVASKSPRIVLEKFACGDFVPVYCKNWTNCMWELLSHYSHTNVSTEHSPLSNIYQHLAQYSDAINGRCLLATSSQSYVSFYQKYSSVPRFRWNWYFWFFLTLQRWGFKENKHSTVLVVSTPLNEEPPIHRYLSTPIIWGFYKPALVHKTEQSIPPKI